MIKSLEGLGVDETAHALLASHLGEELDPNRVRRTALLLGNQIAAAREQGTLKEDLLADAFGLAAWVIGAQPGEEPNARRLAYLPDPRLRVALGLSAITVGSGSG